MDSRSWPDDEDSSTACPGRQCAEAKPATRFIGSPIITLISQEGRSTMRLFKLVSLIVLVALVLSACAAPTAAPAPAAKAEPTKAAAAPAAKAEPTKAAAAPAAAGGDLKVAVLAPLSGPVPTFGVSTRDGALLAIDEWNAKGGVNGKKIMPIVEDSQCTPDPAVNAANKVIDQDKVNYIIGEVCSKASIPVSEIANAKKVIQISPTSTNPAVTVNKDGKTKDYIFRACFIDPFQGTVGAKFAYEHPEGQDRLHHVRSVQRLRQGPGRVLREGVHGGWRQGRGQGELHREQTPTSRPSCPRLPTRSPT